MHSDRAKEKWRLRQEVSNVRLHLCNWRKRNWWQRSKRRLRLEMRKPQESWLANSFGCANKLQTCKEAVPKSEALYASTSISTGMKGATKAMVAMNKQMAPAKQAKVIREFQKQSTQLDMTIEMMSESIDETLDKDEAEEETEELTNQVLDEIGVDIASQLSSAPKGRIASKKIENVVPSSESTDVEDLEKRLASLRRI
ncbi:PREDICTED: vacuolar protein sorting-associated protein 2 homolog 2 isoform X2 [Nelumbo nucifera]|uniref:Vacuolar protein sorting-associated protein 2 homolog 2 isoform X2 n=1 Tax=Nelumbo nucifera TaxID=4432 RepID=A0A1U7ZXX3_NELNU|nr:PREDICTED: vacuolar protein sorting-associated protein 2 homolog 2 isoform X2 [Nelumbo nucifera]